MRAWPARDSRALFGGGEEADACLAVIALNHELPPCTPRLWRAAALRIAADGGANRLYDQLPALLPHLSAEQARRSCFAPWMSRHGAHALCASAVQAREQFLPHVVLGDLDSARPEVLAFYAARGARVVDASADQARALASRTRAPAASTPDAAPLQDTTDLHKCVAFALREPAPGAGVSGPVAAPAARHVVALGALGGRLDHELSALSVLHAFPEARITLLGCHAAATLLSSGAHLLRPCPPLEGPVCGLVPLGACPHAPRRACAAAPATARLLRRALPAAGPAVATSSGLRWDLAATRLAMGELVRCAMCVAAAQRAHALSRRTGEHEQQHRSAGGARRDGRAAGVDHAAAFRRQQNVSCA